MQIYLLKNGQQVGPYTVEVIRGMLSTRYVAPTDQGWHEGLPGWQPLNTFLPSPPKPTAPSPAYAPVRAVQMNVNQGPRIVARGSTSAGSNNSSPIAQNMPSFIAAVLMCIAFFMPWASFGPLGVSASSLASIGGRLMVLWTILIMSVISVITHFVNPKKVLNVVTGIIPLVIFLFAALDKGEKIFNGLGVGAWLTLGCGIALIFAPVKPLQIA